MRDVPVPFERKDPSDSLNFPFYKLNFSEELFHLTEILNELDNSKALKATTATSQNLQWPFLMVKPYMNTIIVYTQLRVRQN